MVAIATVSSLPPRGGIAAGLNQGLARIVRVHT
jgi:hypothetical protein